MNTIILQDPTMLTFQFPLDYTDNMDSPQTETKEPLELSKPAEKLLRSPTFFEKYVWLKPFSILSILIITIIVSAYLLQANTQTTDTIPINPSPTITPQITAQNSTTNWKIYKNIKYGYLIQYPSNKFINCGKDDFYLYEDSKGAQECGLGEEITAFGIINSLEGTGIFQQSVDETCYEVKKESIMIDGTPATKYSNIIRSTEGKCNRIEVSYARNNIHILANYKNTVYNFFFYEDTNKELKYQILSTFKFLDSTEISPQLSCRPRPACLNAQPRCLIPETPDMCPKSTPTSPMACPADAKQCSDGTWVPRTGPKCEFVCPINGLNDMEKNRIKAWIIENNLNIYGDPKDTAYTGGTPLFDEKTGQKKDLYEYIIEKHPDRPWNK